MGWGLETALVGNGFVDIMKQLKYSNTSCYENFQWHFLGVPLSEEVEEHCHEGDNWPAFTE